MTCKRLRPSGGYRSLRSFQTATVIYDATVPGIVIATGLLQRRVRKGRCCLHGWVCDIVPAKKRLMCDVLLPHCVVG